MCLKEALAPLPPYRFPCSGLVSAPSDYYTPAQKERTRANTKTPPRTLASAKKNQKEETGIER